MPVVKVTYERVFRLAEYENERIGIEVIVNEGEDATQAFLDAKKQVEQWHSSATSEGIIQEFIPIPPKSKELQTIDYREKERWEMLIDDCKTLEQLEKHCDQVPKYMVDHYNKRWKQIDNR